MRLADLSALDGAISNIRLWTLGNLEHKILPNKNAINKNTVNNNTVNTDNILKLLGNVQLLEQRCNARIWGFIYDKTTLKKIILLDKIYKVKYATKLKLKDFNNKYILIGHAPTMITS